MVCTNTQVIETKHMERKQHLIWAQRLYPFASLLLESIKHTLPPVLISGGLFERTAAAMQENLAYQHCHAPRRITLLHVANDMS